MLKEKYKLYLYQCNICITLFVKYFVKGQAFFLSTGDSPKEKFRKRCINVN